MTAVTESEGKPSLACQVRIELAVSIKSAAKSPARAVTKVRPAHPAARQTQIRGIKI
jgi:hypothetical protein